MRKKLLRPIRPGLKNRPSGQAGVITNGHTRKQNDQVPGLRVVLRTLIN
jgi:hypothetical protein